MRIPVVITLAMVMVAGAAPIDAQAPIATIAPVGESLPHRALLALGPPALVEAAGSLIVEQRGVFYAGEQSADPAEPIGKAERFYQWHFDAPRGRLLRGADLIYPGGIRFSSQAAVTPEGGWSVDRIRWRTGTDLGRISAQEAAPNRVQFERFMPHLVLRDALRLDADVRLQGSDAFLFRDSGGNEIKVTLDSATWRPLSTAVLVGETVQSEVRYHDYRRHHGVMLPERVELLAGGRPVEDVKLGTTRVAVPADAAFTVPAGYADPPAASPPAARAIAPGVFLLEGMPGDLRSMFVDMGDHVILVEAPFNPAHAALQEKIIAQTLPGKPVRGVISTHHHGDHNGGLSYWAKAGVPIIVAAGAKAAILRQLAGRGAEGATIEEVSGERTLGTGAATLVLHAVASSHAAANLLVYLPTPAILFQGDFFNLPERGEVPPPFPVVAELKRAIQASGFRPRTIVSVHGRPATASDLDRSLALTRTR